MCRTSTRENPLFRSTLGIVVLTLMASATPATTQQGPQTQTDDYTRYELQEPGSAGFRIFYDVSATTAGARYFYNTIRDGAEEEVHNVTDLHTGAALEWELVDGAHARANGHPRANLQSRYIKVALARAVSEGGQGRICGLRHRRPPTRRAASLSSAPSCTSRSSSGPRT